VKRLLAVAAATVATMVAVATAHGTGTVQTAASAGFVSSANGIHLWAPMHTASQAFQSESAAVDAAKRFDLITFNPRQLGGYAAAMKAANPNLKLFAYLNGTFLYKRLYGTVPNSMLAHGSNGQVLQSHGYGNYLGDVDNPAWKSYVEQNCAKLLSGTDYDGCYLDMLGTGPLWPGYLTGLPINPATGQVWTRLDWLQATSGIASAVASYTGKPVLGNGIGNGPRYFAAGAPSKLLLDGATGASAETWTRQAGAPLSYHEPIKAWQQEVDMLGDADNTGGLALTITKAWSAGTAAEKENARLYALATFLLGNGGDSYFYFTANKTDPATLDDPLYHLQIGSPVGGYVVQNGAYVRTFTSGKVVVNPTSSVVSVDLGGSYRRPDGSFALGATLSPYSAQIFTTA
jgi:Hypothetical glycosyl hydrolase family 15